MPLAFTDFNYSVLTWVKGALTHFVDICYKEPV